MARGVVIPFTLNPADFLKGIKRIETSLDDVTDAMRTVERSGDSIENAFDGIGRQAEQEFDRVERAARDVDVTAGLDRGAGRGRARAREIGAETGQEFVESWGEAVRAGNPADAIGETLTNAGMIGMAAGPIGAAIGLGVAVVGGLVAGLGQGRQRVAEATAALWGDVEQAGLSGRAAAEAYLAGFVDRASIGGRLVDVLGVDDAVQAWGRVGQIVQQTGLDAATVSEAILGNRDALNEVLAAQQANQDGYEQLREQAALLWDVDRTRALELLDQADALDAQKKALDGLVTQGSAQAQANQRAADAMLVAQAAVAGTAAPMSTVAADSIRSADAAARWRDAMAGAATQAALTRDRLAEARWQADQIPRSITINVLNKLAASGLQDQP